MNPSVYQPSHRSSYPLFISLGETLSLHLESAKAGLVDAFRWDFVLNMVISDPEIRGNLLKSSLLNTLSLASIWIFDWLLHFTLKTHEPSKLRSGQSFVHRNLGWLYHVFWLAPIVGVSIYLNSTWCNLVAKRMFIVQYGNRALVSQSRGYSGMLNSLATSAYRAVMVFTCVTLSVTLGLFPVPFLSSLLGFLFFCWVNAYYCFEFIWIARGYSLLHRVRHLEERWAYFFAFGLPSTTLCICSSILANAAIFALILPFYIIMATRARPTPTYPYNPIPNDGNVVRYPSPFVPVRLPIFAPVIWLNDSIVSLLSVGVRNVAGMSTVKVDVKPHGGSLDGMDSIEDGARGSSARGGLGMAPGRRRVNLGRKKLD